MLSHRHILFIGADFSIIPVLIFRNGLVEYAVYLVAFLIVLLFLPSYSRYFYRTNNHKLALVISCTILSLLSYWLYIIDGNAWSEKEIANLFIAQDLLLLIPVVLIWTILLHSAKNSGLNFREDLET